MVFKLPYNLKLVPFSQLNCVIVFIYYIIKTLAIKFVDLQALYHLNVENLVIPSVPERTNNWIQGYGFHHLHASMKREIMLHNTLTFHDSIRLQKILKPPRIRHGACSSREHGGLVDRSKAKATFLDWILKPSR